MAEFVSGLPLLSHPRVWEWVLKSCLAFKRILEEDARFEKNLIADGIPQILKSWDEEEDQACYCTLLHSVGKTESMSSFFLPPSFVACFISISFIFHFAIFMGMWMVSDTYYNRSACVILDAVVFTFLYLSHSTCHTFMKYSFRCLLKQDWKGQPWKRCHSDHLYTNIHRNQWINFSHIFNLEMGIDWVNFRRNKEK